MDAHRDVKPYDKGRLGDKRRMSLSPESAERRSLKLKCDIDVHILVCIICKDTLSPPVCQCRNGHMACQVCCKRHTHGKCPNCFQPIGRTRNKVVEEIIATLRVPCKRAGDGCKKMLATATKKHHEQCDCEYILLDCPFPDCRFTSCIRKYSSHVAQQHRDARVIRQNEREQLLTFGSFSLHSRDDFVLLQACAELFLLHQECTVLGQMIYITSCGKDKRYSVEVVITSEYEKEPRTFKVETLTSNGRTSSGLRDFLLVPKQNIGSYRLPGSARCTVVIHQDEHLKNSSPYANNSSKTCNHMIYT